MKATLAFVLCCAATFAQAQTPVSALLKPPPGATTFALLSTAKQHGQTLVWTDQNGARCSRESLNMRGFISETDQCATLAPDHTIRALTIRGFTPTGDAGETFSVANATATWHSPIDAGTAAAGTAIYVPYGGTFDATAMLFDLLMATPGHQAALYPSGRASLQKLTDTTIGAGANARTLTIWELNGLSFEPVPILADAAGHFFGQVNPFLSMLRPDAAGELKHLIAAQSAAIAQQSPGILRRVLQPDTGPVSFAHVKMFDAEAGLFRSDMTVTTAGGHIQAVGPADTQSPPPAARIIDGTGKTLLPGLWEMHQHYGDDASGPLLLAQGITSARDPGNDNDMTLDRARRRAAGLLLAPRVYPSSLLDGRSPTTAQLGTTIASLDEAIAAVRRAKQDGFTGIKIYSSFNPAWVAATAAEAHRLGLHVHGHVPAGMRPLDAINAGYDEITHINFVMMQAMPDDVVIHSNTSQRMIGMGRYAATVDLNAEPMKSLIETMAARKIAVDPTLVVFEAELVPDPGDLSPAYAPFIGTLPPNAERGFRSGGTAVPQGATRAQFRASFAKLQALVGVLHAHGVRLVAGTDGLGIELVHELELYVAAGLSPADALETTTLNAARLVGVDNRTGSIKVGKDADLVLIDGDPEASISDLRHTRLVMMGGRLMDADALRKEAGFTGGPK
jgi:imidazolonepropionase-like amidohydrolase